MISHIPLQFHTKVWSNLQQSIENWFQYYLNPDTLSFGGYLMMFFVVMLLFSVCLTAVGRFKGFFDWMSRYLLGTALLFWILGVALYIIGFYNDQLNALAIVPRAIISSFKMFVVSNDLARVHEVLRKDALYMTVFSLVHFVAAYITFLFIFKMVGYKIKSSLNILLYKCFKAKGRNAHVFWGVNEASLLFAEDIRRIHKDDTLVFIDVDEEREDNSPKKATLSHITNSITIKNSEIVRLDAMEALVDHCFNGPIAVKDSDDIFGTLRLNDIGGIVQRSERTSFYFFSDDEEQNVQAALNMLQDSKLNALKNRPVIYVHARKSANNEVVDHYLQYDDSLTRMEIKIVDSAHLSIDMLKQDKWALPINSVDFDPKTGVVNSPFTAMIVGMGATGLEAFKFLYEYAAFVDKDGKKTPFKCYALDAKMDKIAGLIRSKMPAITEEELVLIKAEVDSEVFWNKIKEVTDELNYIVIALNDDTLGLSLAVNLFKYALMHRCHSKRMLKIVVRCYENGTKRRMEEVVRNLNRSIEPNQVEIRLFGEKREMYRSEMILSEHILRDAKEFNRVYERSELSADDQWNMSFGEKEITRLMEKKGMSRYHAIYDINRRIMQNVSNVLHQDTKLILMGLDGKDSFAELERFNDYVEARKEGTVIYPCGNAEAKLLNNLARVEHERWVASHKLMGYTYHSKNDHVRKYHWCICSWEELDEFTQSYDCNVVDTTIKLACQAYHII